MKESLQPNKELIDEIKRPRLTNPQLKVFGLSNILAQDFQQFQPLIDKWGIFDDFYVSGLTGLRKPDAICYERFLENCNISPTTCVFLDDRIENVIAVQSLGLRGVHFKDAISAAVTLNNLFGDPVVRGMEFPSRNANKLLCETDTGQRRFWEASER